MDEKQIWLVLETEPTKEEEQIKQAYRKKLARTNPEDDPEGFKRLREAMSRRCVWRRKRRSLRRSCRRDRWGTGFGR